jgi:hypothetical protein
MKFNSQISETLGDNLCLSIAFTDNGLMLGKEFILLLIHGK